MDTAKIYLFIRCNIYEKNFLVKPHYKSAYAQIQCSTSQARCQKKKYKLLLGNLQRRCLRYHRFYFQTSWGGKTILQYAGMDITHVLTTTESHVHSPAAFDMLKDYRIGKLLQRSISPNNSVDLVAVQQQGTANHLGISLTSLTNNNSNKKNDNHSSSSSSINIFDKTEEENRSNSMFHWNNQRLNKSLPAAAGTITNERNQQFLDLNRPLFPQLFYATYSKQFYLEQVNRPRFVSHHVPYFPHPCLDLFTYAAWYMVPLVWVPIICYYLYSSIDTAADLGTTIKWFIFGIFLFTLIEYFIHRFMLHTDYWVPDHPWALLVHFSIHGIHHHIPMDRSRLVLPPLLSLAVGACVHQTIRSIMPNDCDTTIIHAILAGACCGYIYYDCTHYYLHHARYSMMDITYLKEMKRHHLNHHYKNSTVGYGVTSKIWDDVFGT
ncbi:hypothetical protein BDA99DRAFT_537474 [Phascolomyces articulosus]|uniref:Fatty acid hydroxylase domain-containing protein n=1 Tax=Phascolomyces articulosus TaxID=60185 RepID=A0AAD5JZD3_9FUNG|nr:hypothetical protein BDA99DRAFT_537474 [Phascolomyces articulosus]